MGDPVVRRIVDKLYATEPDPFDADEAFATWYFLEFGFRPREEYAGVVDPARYRSAWEAGRKYERGGK
jgi:hypothetical protein